MDDALFGMSETPLIGSYKVTGKIGTGAFSEVFKGIHIDTGQEVALKHITGQFQLRGRNNMDANQTLTRELTAMQHLSHRHIVELLDAIPQGDGLVLVLELCAIDLAEALQHTSQRMDEALVKAILFHLLQGVAAFHEAGYLHRDLKPANLLLTWEGELKVADMGLARARDVTLERSAGYTHTVATRWYRAPELLLASHSYGPAADMWSVGCILAEMLGAGPLFAGDTDLDQLGRVVAVLGSINVQDWPEVTALPDFGKVTFADTPPTKMADILTDASKAALDLLLQLLLWNPEKRLTASAAMQHPYFSMEPLPVGQCDMAAFVSKSCSAKEVSRQQTKRF